MSNSVYQNQAKNLVESDLGFNCLQRLSTDVKKVVTSGLRVKGVKLHEI